MIRAAVVPGVPTSAQGTSVSNTTNSPTLDPNQFLKLLVAELQYQDPTKPMDTNQLVQQLSTISQVEQSAQTNSKLTAILDQLSVGQGASLIGRTVTSADGATSGVVESVRLESNRIVTTLSDGQKLEIGAGVTISQ